METETIILEAALKLFASRGYDATTTRAIAEAASVNEVTLFRKFETKQNLLAEVMRVHKERCFVIMDSAMQSMQARSARETFGGITRGMMRILHEEHDFMRLSIMEEFRKHYSEPRSGPARSAMLGRLIMMIQEFIKQDEIATVDPLVAAMMYSGFFVTLLLGKGNNEDRLFPEDNVLIESFLNIFFHGIMNAKME